MLKRKVRVLDSLDRKCAPQIAEGENSCLWLRHRELCHVIWALIFEEKELFHLTKSTWEKKITKIMDTGHNTILIEKILQTHYPTPKGSGRIFNCSRWVCTLHRTHHAAGIITIREHWRRHIGSSFRPILALSWRLVCEKFLRRQNRPANCAPSPLSCDRPLSRPKAYNQAWSSVLFLLSL